MRTTEQRIAKYNAKYHPATVGLKYGARLDGMLDAYAAFANSMAAVEEQTVGVLCSLDVPPKRFEVPFYLDFARELWHLVNTVDLGGKFLNQEASSLKAKWVARGLQGNTLSAIASQVFGIVLP